MLLCGCAHETPHSKATAVGRAVVPCVQKGDTAMAAHRILYVSYNPATLIRDELSLILAGCELDSVLGEDGLRACGSIAEYASVLIDHSCPHGRRKKMISWLQSTYPKVDILPATGFASMQASGTARLMREGIYLREVTGTFANCRV